MSRYDEEAMAGAIDSLVSDPYRAMQAFTALLGPGVDRSADVWTRADWPAVLGHDAPTIRRVIGDRQVAHAKRLPAR